MGSKKVDSKHKLIGFKAFLDRDEDIVVWWELLPPGERSHVLRSLIRAFLHGQIVTTPLGEAPTTFSRSVQIAQVDADTRWIKDALLDLPGYLEEMLMRVGRSVAQTMPASIPPVTAVPPAGGVMSAGPPLSIADITDSEADLRTSRILKTRW